MNKSVAHFDITLSDASRIQGEYRSGEQLVIFSHGFDVRRDSNGLFHDIANSLPESFGYIIFDYHAYDGAFESLRPLSEQADILRQVVTWAKAQLHPVEIHLVAHSMGCTIASYAAESSFSTVTYLAPPLHSGKGLRRFFTTHPGLIHADDNAYVIERRSGKTSKVSEKFLREFESAQPLAYLKNYAKQRPLTIIAANQDKHIPPTVYDELSGEPTIAVLYIDGDHNFSESSRATVCSQLIRILTPTRH